MLEGLHHHTHPIGSSRAEMTIDEPRITGFRGSNDQPCALMLLVQLAMSERAIGPGRVN